MCDQKKRQKETAMESNTKKSSKFVRSGWFARQSRARYLVSRKSSLATVCAGGGGGRVKG
jgi:hypothetical protein